MEAGFGQTKLTVLVENVLENSSRSSRPVRSSAADGSRRHEFRGLPRIDRGHSIHGLGGVTQKGEPPLKPAIATLPSVTEVCRRSLLCGRLMAGTGEDEKQGFRQSKRTCVQVSKPGAPPILFQKSDLTDAGRSLAGADLRREIASSKRRVVAAIVNAVDDHLLKGEQVAVPWTLRHIPVLSHLLAAAMESGRLVILTSDHGHVLDRRTSYRSCDRRRAISHLMTATMSRTNEDPGWPDESCTSQRATHRALVGKGPLRGKRNGYHGGAVSTGVCGSACRPGWPQLRARRL